jgi:hypothetical protein
MPMTEDWPCRAEIHDLGWQGDHENRGAHFAVIKSPMNKLDFPSFKNDPISDGAQILANRYPQSWTETVLS